MSHPIPTAALDDRLAFVGNTGSGKTYAAGTAVERLLASGARVVIPDPLGVWWGLALASDGKSPSIFRKQEKLVIFGGPRGDLALTENSGALIGETVAGMAESCILDLSELRGKASERRFMLAFLEALYRHKTNEPLHVIFDEGDMWAPQRILDKEGEAMKLLGMMETICRRGRVKGFIPWLISQRPAVISKNVLSQIDGMIALKLTSVQDRDAIGDWVEGQADAGQWKAMWANMATMERGQGVVWLPARGVLKTTHFPEKITFDSSRAPKRGERMKSAKALQPVNLDKLKARLATVETESKSNDPRALKAELARVTADLHRLRVDFARKPLSDPGTIKKAERDSYMQGAAEAAPIWFRRGVEAAIGEVKNYVKGLDLPSFINAQLKTWKEIGAVPARPAPIKPAPRIEHEYVPALTTPRVTTGAVPAPHSKIMDAIAWWNAVGHQTPSRAQVAFVAGYKPGTGTFNTYLGALSSANMISYPRPGYLALTAEGFAITKPATTPTVDELRERVRAVLNGPQMKIVEVLMGAYPEALTRTELAEQSGYQPGTGTFNTYVGSLSSLEIIEYPNRGDVRAADWLFQMRAAA